VAGDRAAEIWELVVGEAALSRLRSAILND
jgi:hypothetical protein